MKVDAPKGLSAEAKRLWHRTVAVWPLGNEETLLVSLRNACFALDRLRAAEAELGKIGSSFYTDRYGSPRQHPLCMVIRDSSKQLNDALRMLNLDWEAVNRDEDHGAEEDDYCAAN
jgi:phage terminase small subunit